jgi:hypothetical protein
MYELMNREKSIICGPKNESLADFVVNFKTNYPEFLKKNVIVDLSKLNTIKNSDLIQFLNTAIAHFKSNTSFVIIYAHADIDNLPEQLVTAPSLIEAIDIIELDEISRDLGF